MSNRVFLFPILVLTILFTVSVCTSCSDSKKEKQEQELPEDSNPMVEELDETPDEAFLARLEGIEGNKLILLDLSTNEKKTYDYSDAKNEGQIKGSLTIGDTLSIFPENKSNKVVISVNTSEMSGRWFFDMQQHRGFRFEHQGAMSTINAGDISFTEWKLLNGKLYIYYLDLQQKATDRHQYKVEEADIKSLSRKNLIFQFIGKTYNCKRQIGLIKFGH